MSELRWVLLGLGVALILGLWWRESRRASVDVESTKRRSSRSEPQVGEAESGERTPEQVAERPPSAADRIRANRRPPVIQIPDDLEMDVAEYISLDRRKSFPVAADPGPQQAGNPAPGAPTSPVMTSTLPSRDEEDFLEPWTRTQPLDLEKIPSRPEPVEPVPEDPRERETMFAAKQRIIALRLVTVGDRWLGNMLRDALEGENLRFGKYSVFHREREDGKSIFYVASMMEPGSFSLETMEGETFSGVSLFAVVPGPVDAPTVFDQMLSTARRLADKLKGRLQDEQGSSLTAQRILNLREELVHLEHISKRLRRP